MAMTKDRLDETATPARERRDPGVQAPADAWATAEAEAPPVVGLHRPAAGPVGEREHRVARTPLRARMGAPITGEWVAIGAVAWAVLLTVGIVVEPPANPNAVDPWYVGVLGAMLLVALPSAFAGLWLRRGWGWMASLAASGVLVAATVLCPVSGHHTQVGAWWGVQLGCGLGLVTVSSLGLRRAGSGVR
jgi:hypothetical protein